jgi:hypothetical protein
MGVLVVHERGRRRALPWRARGAVGYSSLLLAVASVGLVEAASVSLLTVYAESQQLALESDLDHLNQPCHPGPCTDAQLESFYSRYLVTVAAATFKLELVTLPRGRGRATRDASGPVSRRTLASGRLDDLPGRLQESMRCVGVRKTVLDMALTATYGQFIRSLDLLLEAGVNDIRLQGAPAVRGKTRHRHTSRKAIPAGPCPRGRGAEP